MTQAQKVFNNWYREFFKEVMSNLDAGHEGDCQAAWLASGKYHLGEAKRVVLKTVCYHSSHPREVCNCQIVAAIERLGDE